MKSSLDDAARLLLANKGKRTREFLLLCSVVVSWQDFDEDCRGEVISHGGYFKPDRAKRSPVRLNTRSC